MDKTKKETDRRSESGKKGDGEEGETGREVSSTEEGDMWEQEEDRLCWWRLCVSTSVCCAHVSGYATHRKQTAAIIHPPPHTHTTRKQPHTRPTAQEIKSKTHTNMKARAHTHTPTEPVPNAPLCSQMSCTHNYAHRHTHFPYTPNKHIPPPT